METLKLFIPSKLRAVTTHIELKPTNSMLFIPSKLRAVTTFFVDATQEVTLFLPSKPRVVTTSRWVNVLFT